MERIRFVDYLKDYLEINQISNKEFANRINVTPKHLIDLLSGKCELSTLVIEHISIATSIPAEYIYKIEMNYHLETEIDQYLKSENLTQTEYLKKFNYQYLIQEKWIKFTDCDDKMEIIKDILKFLRISSPEKVSQLDKNLFYKSKNDKPELLLLWLEKCYREVLKQKVGQYHKENIPFLVNYIQEKAKLNIFDEREMIQVFNEKGIGLVIQKDIPGSKIRGAFKVHRNMPAIYITYKHKRIADVYFALYHELAHCKSDFNKAKSINLVSYENEKDVIEQKADHQAFSWMVDDHYYNDHVLKEGYSLENETSYPRSFVVYRLAYDHLIEYNSKEYQHLNKILE